MNKKELIKTIAEKTGFTQKDVEVYLNAFTDVVAESLTNNTKVSLVGFGTFEVVNREARVARNPKDGSEVQVPAKKVPKFKASKTLKEIVNQ